MRRACFSTALLAAALLLTGCGAGPGDAKIKAAIAKSLQESHSPLRLIDKAMRARLKAVKQIGCSKVAEGAAFICDIQMAVETTNPMTGKVTSRDGMDKLRLVKIDNRWAISR